LLQLQQENKKKVSLLNNVLIPSFLPFRKSFFLRNVRRGRRWEKAKSEDPFPWPKGKQLMTSLTARAERRRKLYIQKNNYSEIKT
ncbi:hypothetical protein, partial [Alkalicoccus saliphilus]